ncbi:SusC/RagA family TonB-linked outer membrane protein [Niabella hibiscisoli]|uniref:SusC/RagA family TonB-linked outer membrane protein n=1 Tax=Niabella hibiscisoli TaxID=1825928 RepID=UPI001F109A07|nr:SusC/RagA family TonB-linked outer membrane protein [Niabella hibiscisoli]MCH5719792.1 carboxypeptidase-like regulatory domain-containing protein [Niabella hibiscisoli]
MRNAEKITLSVDRAPLADVLNRVLAPNGLGYSIDDKIVIIRKITEKVVVRKKEVAPVTMAPVEPVRTIVRGTVKNEDNDPVSGASIIVEGTKRGTSTDGKGEFSLDVDPGQTLLVSAVGYNTTRVKVGSSLTLHIILKLIDKTEEVVTVNTGMYTRKKETYTGAVATFSGADLRKVGNQNLVQSLRSVDPSFLIMENNFQGSNPNVLPTIELRGQSSLTTSTNSLVDEFADNPNQPLFVLDGFETSLKTITELDVTQVASINILKDASATAIYGSRASNGVIVVETIRPQLGTVRLRYTGDFSFELPDLSGYNMMNAREKLEFERLSGAFRASVGMPELANSYYGPLYSEKLQFVESGVNSYWLTDPLQTGFFQRHSLYADGGNQYLSFNVGGTYKAQQGVMIGSGNKEWSGRVNLTYRKNKININNNLYINGYKQDNSNYGSFSTWVNTNPYFEKAAADVKYLYEFYNWNTEYGNGYEYMRAANPFYNASLNSFNNAKSYTITNNLQLNYNVTNNLRIQGALQVGGSNTEANVFKSPLHTDFDNTTTLKKVLITTPIR